MFVFKVITTVLIALILIGIFNAFFYAEDRLGERILGIAGLGYIMALLCMWG